MTVFNIIEENALLFIYFFPRKCFTTEDSISFVSISDSIHRVSFWCHQTCFDILSTSLIQEFAIHQSC